MERVIPFPQERRYSKEVRNLKAASDKLDNLILEALYTHQIPPHEMAGLIAHRLGALMKHLDHKDALWILCAEVLKKQAALG